MPYCPIKLVVAKLAANPYVGAFMEKGGYPADAECDKEKCGFWSVKHIECGISAIGRS